MKKSRQVKYARKAPKEYSTNLSVLKSNTNIRAARNHESNADNEEEKLKPDRTSVDMRQVRRDPFRSEISIPSKKFQFQKASSDPDAGEQDDKMYFSLINLYYSF